ncbi:MAG: HAD family phosphatase [Breznakibacter sp.]
MEDGIRNIIFDLGNVVIDIDPQRTIDRFNEIGFQNVEAFLGHSRSMGFMADFQVGRMTERNFFDEVRRCAELSISDDLIKDAWNAMLLDYDVARVKKLMELKLSYRIFLFSNTNVTHFHNFADRVPLVGHMSNLFEKTFYSHEIGLAKPEPKAYKQVMELANINAGETIFFDDLPENVEAALTVGLKARLVEHPNQWMQWV